MKNRLKFVDKFVGGWGAGIVGSVIIPLIAFAMTPSHSSK